MPSRQDIDLILRAEVEAALREFRAANQQFSDVIREVGKSYVAPDGSLAGARASARRRAAMAGLEKALKRHNGWILEGVLPDDLAEPDLAEPPG